MVLVERRTQLRERLDPLQRFYRDLCKKERAKLFSAKKERKHDTKIQIQCCCPLGAAYIDLTDHEAVVEKMYELDNVFPEKQTCLIVFTHLFSRVDKMAPQSKIARIF